MVKKIKTMINIVKNIKQVIWTYNKVVKELNNYVPLKGVKIILYDQTTKINVNALFISIKNKKHLLLKI